MGGRLRSNGRCPPHWLNECAVPSSARAGDRARVGGTASAVGNGADPDERTSATGAHRPNADCEHRKHVPNVIDPGGAASLKNRLLCRPASLIWMGVIVDPWSKPQQRGNDDDYRYCNRRQHHPFSRSMSCCLLPGLFSQWRDHLLVLVPVGRSAKSGQSQMGQWGRIVRTHSECTCPGTSRRV